MKMERYNDTINTFLFGIYLIYPYAFIINKEGIKNKNMGLSIIYRYSY